MKKLNRLYKEESPFWELDNTWDGFQWINADDSAQNCLSFLRKDRLGNKVVCVFNFAPVERPIYRIGVPNSGTYSVILDTSDIQYGGSNKQPYVKYKSEKVDYNGFNYSINLKLAPMSALYIRAPKQKSRGEIK